MRQIVIVGAILALSGCVQLSDVVQRDALHAAQVDPPHAWCYGAIGDLAADLSASDGGLLTGVAAKERGRRILVGPCAPIVADVALSMLKLKVGLFATAFVPVP